MAVAIPPTKFDMEFTAGSQRALIRGSEGEIQTGDIITVPPSMINVRDGLNLRVRGTKRYQDKVEEIGRSIIQEGFYKDKPLTCYIALDAEGKDALYLADGHMRMAAIEWIKEQGGEPPVRVPVIVKPKTTSAVDITVAMYKTGTPLTTYEMALGVKRLEGLGLEDEEIAKRIGVSERYLDDLRALLAVPVKIRNLLVADLVASTLVMDQVRELGPKAAAIALTEAAKEVAGTGRRATKRDVQRVIQGGAIDGVERPTGRAPKPGTYTFNFASTAGTEIPTAEIAHFTSLFGGDWYEHTTVGQVRVTRDIKITMKVVRPPLEAEGTESTAEETESEGEGAESTEDSGL